MKKSFTIIAFLLVISLLLPACMQQSNQSGAGTIKIGAILPLTGSASENGEFQKQGIEIAVEEINQAGGIKGQKLEIVYGDSKNEAKEGISLFTKFSDVDKLPISICTMSGISAPLASYVAGLPQHNSVLFATVASAPGLAKKNEWIFRSFVTSDVEAAKMADFAFKTANMKKMAILYVNDDYGLGGLNVFKPEFEKLGGKIVFAEPFEKGATDFRTSILKMKAENPEGIYVVGYDKSYATVIKQIGEAQTGAKIFSTVSLSVPSWLELAGSSAEGAYFTASLFGDNQNDAATAKFIETYKQKYNREPNYVSAVTYSIIKMTASAIESKGYTADGIRQGLSEIKNFNSLVGSITIDADREGSMPVKIMKIEGGKVVAVEQKTAVTR
jgi:branched-chain amino acid transport system substrate-binding protein